MRSPLFQAGAALPTVRARRCEFPSAEHEKGNDSEALEQKDSEHETALRAADVALVDKLLEPDGGR